MQNRSFLDFFEIIPKNQWNPFSWRQTLRKEIKKSIVAPARMEIRTTAGFRLNSNKMGIGHSFEVTEPARISGFSSLEYWWDSTDGRTIDCLNFRGPFSTRVLEKLVSTLRKTGLELSDRWSLVVVLYGATKFKRNQRGSCQLELKKKH